MFLGNENVLWVEGATYIRTGTLRAVLKDNLPKDYWDLVENSFDKCIRLIQQEMFEQVNLVSKNLQVGA